jgi:hypothetical protein
MALIEERTYVINVCKLGKRHECCRYLVGGPDGFQCVKHVLPLCTQLDERVAAETMSARGDNCDGK